MQKLYNHYIKCVFMYILINDVVTIKKKNELDINLDSYRY